MKYNYPIRYAIMPIENISNNEEDLGYIISKCYLISEKVEYYQKGNKKNEYEVVFPYERKDYLSRNELFRVFPEFNINHQCLNSSLVDKVFLTYEEAENYCNEINEDIVNTEISKISPTNSLYRGLIINLKQKFYNTLDEYEVFENLLIKDLNEPSINNNTNNYQIIVYENNEYKVSQISLYEYIELCSYIPFSVYSISLEDKEALLNNILNKVKFDFNNLAKTKILVNDTENQSLRIVDRENSNSSSYFIINGYITEDNQPKELKETSPKKIIITSETLKDIFESYHKSDENIRISDVKKLIK